MDKHIWIVDTNAIYSFAGYAQVLARFPAKNEGTRIDDIGVLFVKNRNC